MYHPRTVDSQLASLLNAVGAVVLEGPKASGKTRTALQVAKSVVRLDVDPNARRAVAIDPSLILEGETPRLIDEWQLEPEIWNHVRRAVDDRESTGQFILTGSAVPSDDVTRHTGAGRFARLMLRPMSLHESGHSTGDISFSALMEGERSRCGDPGLDVREIARRVVIGGWPGLIDKPPEQAGLAVRAYVDEVRRTDIQRVDGVAHDPQRVLQLLRSFARNVGTMAGIATMAKDIAGAERAIDEDTAYRYYEALGRLMIIEDQPAWAPHLRSRSRVRVSPKRHFVDPSLAVAVLRATPERLLEDLNLLGLLFESMAIRDLRVYAQAQDAHVLHYKDNTDLEVDAIVERPDGAWGAFEIKLGTTYVEEAAKNLRTFADRVDTRKCGPPRALAVITGFGLGYTRPDGIHVIPIGALRP
jgi:predicted AAA+ superfamily ATPase